MTLYIFKKQITPIDTFWLNLYLYLYTNIWYMFYTSYKHTFVTHLWNTYLLQFIWDPDTPCILLECTRLKSRKIIYNFIKNVISTIIIVIIIMTWSRPAGPRRIVGQQKVWGASIIMTSNASLNSYNNLVGCSQCRSSSSSS